MSISEAALYQLLSWLSPAYPVGSFAHSSGLEWAVEAGYVDDRATLQDWLTDVLSAGTGWNDAVLFTHAYRAVGRRDQSALDEVAELAAAPSSYERGLETLAQGEAFWRIAKTASPCGAMTMLDGLEGERAYPVVVAVTVAGHGIKMSLGLTAYLHGLAGNLVSAAQRLVPLGQTDGQLTIAALRPVVAQTVQHAVTLGDGDPFDHLGTATLMADIATMLHETQYTRLFRT